MGIYVDGSCTGNGKNENSGGFGVVEINEQGKVVFAYAEHCENTTNNREELKAILYATKKYGTNNNFLVNTIYSDSNYCVQALNNWMFNWFHNNWLKSDRKPPENLDLIKEYFNYRIIKNYCLNLEKIRGHSGILGNELADKLATKRITPEEVMLIYG
jgi:ribonuclease HI